MNLTYAVGGRAGVSTPCAQFAAMSADNQSADNLQAL